MKRGQLILATALVVTAGWAYGCADTGPAYIPLSTGTTNPTGGQGGAAGEGGMVAGDDAYAMYANSVHDNLVEQCGFCHNEGKVGAPEFLSADGAEVAYSRLEAHDGLIQLPASSTLLLKGEHAGPAMSSELHTVVTSWLTHEAEERGLVATTTTGGEPPKATLDDALAEFAACMRLDVWNGVGMGLIPQNQTQGEGPCLGCHNQGVGGLFLDINAELNFNQTKDNKYHLLKYVAAVYKQTSGDFDHLSVSSRLWDKGAEPSLATPSHPKFSLLAANQKAVEDFVNYTLMAIENGTCDQPYMSMQ